MRNCECVAMILAGGQGSRLGALTSKIAKPAVPFGGKYRIIDFPLSNCANSGITTVGVLTQYQPLELNTYIGSGQPWDMDRLNGGVFVLPPFVRGKKGEWYKGTANAIYQNIQFLEQFSPENVLVLSGDHIYKMDYRLMLNFHKENKADATIAVFNVPLSEAGRYGIMAADAQGRIREFMEKPEKPASTLASMGVYIFSSEVLKRYLEQDEGRADSSNDFGKDVIPSMLNDGRRLFAYSFKGYWKDVGTVKSLWEANMDLLGAEPVLDLNDDEWRIYSRNSGQPAQYISIGANVSGCAITEGCKIYGTVKRSVLSTGVIVEEGARVYNSIIMPNSIIKEGAVVNNAVIAEGAVIGRNAVIGSESPNVRLKKSAYCEELTLIGEKAEICADARIGCGVMLEKNVTEDMLVKESEAV